MAYSGRILKRAKRWNLMAEDVRMLPENNADPVARVLTAEEKRRLFQTAAAKPDWLVAHCTAVLAASTTCRSVELRHLRWKDVDLFGQVVHVRRSKTPAGHRTNSAERRCAGGPGAAARAGRVQGRP